MSVRRIKSPPQDRDWTPQGFIMLEIYTVQGFACHGDLSLNTGDDCHLHMAEHRTNHHM